MTRTRILIADDFPLFRKGVREFLETQPGYEVVGEAATGREALVKAKHLKPHVVILDISMPELNGLEATREILKAVPETEVLVLTLHESEDLVHKVLEAGARGYVLKSDAEPTLLEAIEAVRQHKAFFASKVAAMVLEAYLKGGNRLVGEKASPHELTPRERQIVQLLAEGKSNKEVASALEISLHTVVTHRSNIMHKLEVHSVSELVRYAIRNNLASA
ncbi:MAG: response regulator transcription factor [Terriglobia bacterium]|jgi:DNA-binding NarL/FixJ family response regulator